MENKEIKLVNLQMLSNIIFIGTIIVSLILLYNQKLSLLQNKSFLNVKEKYLINVSNQFIVFILALIFLYINYEKYKSANPKGKDLESLNIIASSLITIATIITLYGATRGAGEEEDVILQTPFV